MTCILSKFLEPTAVLLALSVTLFASFGMTRLTKKLQLPNVSGYIIAGILIGPSFLNLIPAEMITHMEFVSDVARTCIALGVGQFFRQN